MTTYALEPDPTEVDVPAGRPAPRKWGQDVSSMFSGAGQGLKDVVTFPVDVVKKWASASGIDYGDLLKNPSILADAAMRTGGDIAEMAPTIVGATAGGVLTGGNPFGMAGGAALMRGTQGVIKGENPEEFARGVTSAGVGTLAGAGTPELANIPSKAVRRLASSGSRMAGAAEAMEKIPERFGVTDDLVNQKYTDAKNSMTPATPAAPVTNFVSRLQTIKDGIEKNPYTRTRNTALLNDVSTTLDEATSTAGLVKPDELNAAIKGINDKIGSNWNDPPVRGAWKHVLSGLHEDMRAAAASTGDPAFSAYADAIGTARLNFLRRDLEDAINKSGIRETRAKTLLTKPENIRQWITNHPDWQAGVEKSQPGLLDSIRGDLKDLDKITTVSATRLPGSQFGSGRGLIGGAIGYLFRNALGLAPGTAEALGVLGGNLSTGSVNFDPSRTLRAFTRPSTPPSSGGGIAGAGVSAMQTPVGGEGYLPRPAPGRPAPGRAPAPAPEEDDYEGRGTSGLSGELGNLPRPGGGFSSELSVGVQDPSLNQGRNTNIPLLVKGQEDVDALLRGEKPTRKQIGIAIRRAVERGQPLASYDTWQEADAATLARHKKIDEKLAADRTSGAAPSDLPPAAQFSGKMARDPSTGERWVSDGTRWSRMP